MLVGGVKAGFGGAIDCDMWLAFWLDIVLKDHSIPAYIRVALFQCLASAHEIKYYC